MNSGVIQSFQIYHQGLLRVTTAFAAFLDNLDEDHGPIDSVIQAVMLGR